MKHKLNLKKEEKVKAWLALNAFIFRLISCNFSKKDLNKRLRLIRDEQEKKNELYLSFMARAK